MKNIKKKGLLALALATTINISSSINVFAYIDGFVAKDPISKELYQYYEADFMDNFKKQNESQAFFYEFLSALNDKLIYLIHDDSGKYISYQKVLKEFEVKEAKGETFDINKYSEKEEMVMIPDYVYNRKIKGNMIINELNLIKDNTNKDFNKDKFKDFEDVRLTGNNITISNGQFKGTLTVDPGKSGTSFVNNIRADNIRVLSGSENGIHFFNVDANDLEVNSDSKTRVEARGETKIGKTIIKTYAILDSVSATYGEIRIAIAENNKGEEEKTVEFRGEFTEPIIVESSAIIKVHEKTIIPKVEVSPKDKNAEIKLYGKFKDVVVKKECKLSLGENTKVDYLKSDVFINLKGDKTASIIKLDVPKNVNKSDVKASQIINTNEENNNVDGKTENTKSKAKEKPSKAEEKPSKAEEKPSKPEEKPSKAEEKPSKPEEKPSKAEEKPSKAEEKPSKPEEKPSKAEEKPSKPDNQENELAVVDIEKSRIMETEYVYYGVIVLKQGTVNDYELFIDDKKIDVEKVNTKGTILKFELKDAKDKKLTVKKDNKKQEILLKVGNSNNSSTDNNVNQVKLIYSINSIVESDANDGEIKDVIDVTLEAIDNNVEFVDGLSGAIFSTMPKGLILKQEKINNKKLRFYVEGKAEKHINVDDSVLRMEFTKEVFKNLKDNTKFVDLVKEIKIDFKDSGENNGQTQQEEKIIYNSKTKIMEIENIIYAVITLKEGTVDNYEFFIDGKKISLEKVNVQGTILKIELNDLKDKELIVKKGNMEEKITLKNIR